MVGGGGQIVNQPLRRRLPPEARLDGIVDHDEVFSKYNRLGATCRSVDRWGRLVLSRCRGPRSSGLRSTDNPLFG